MKILVVGSNGQVGNCLKDEASSFGFSVVGYDLPEIDITSLESVKSVFEKEKPELLINAAAFTAVDKAEEEVELSYLVNDKGTENLAIACNSSGIPFFHISTDYVFDGEEGMYMEDSPVNPQSVYGASKLAGEISAKNYCTKTLILRTSWVFSSYGNNFLKTMVKLARTRDELGIVSDQKGAPTSARDIAKALLLFATEFKAGKDIFGTYHFTGSPYATWYDFAKQIFQDAETAKLIDKQPKVNAIKTSEYPLPAKRPMDSRLDCSKIFNNLDNIKNDWRPEVARIVQKLQEEGF